VLVTPSQVNESGFTGSPLVLADDSLLVPGADPTRKVGTIYHYVPSTTTLTVWGTDQRGTNYGTGLVLDAQGNVLTLGTIFNPSGTMSQVASWIVTYGVITPTAYFAINNGQTGFVEMCLDGTGSMPYGSGITDGYGLAVGTDGALYSSQGNHNPANVWKLPPGALTATSIATVPMNVMAVVADPSGKYIYLAGSGDGNTVWRVDTSTGTKVVYGCDTTGSTRACGATM
jgi:hypothetical protein